MYKTNIILKKLKSKEIEMIYNPDSILTMYRGSIAHNMYTPDTDSDSIDDIDLMLVCVPPIDNYFGLKQYGSRGTKEIKQGKWDIVLYEVRKFINMLKNGNPNVLGCLWLKDEHYIKKTTAGELLIKNRNLFVGKHVYKSFIGYANGQLKRMEHHACQGYMGAKRKKLVEKFGYDTHNAAHLIRLLEMGIEFLETGEMVVFRSDADFFLSIKRGEWELDTVKKDAKRLFGVAKEVYEKSKLPKNVDAEKINKLCIEIVQTAFEEE